MRIQHNGGKGDNSPDRGHKLVSQVNELFLSVCLKAHVSLQTTGTHGES